jgi:dTDP-4-dehydrorhamnose 3,5-epimerase-like enzyme
MDIEIKGGLSMNHENTQSDWRTVASCLASQNYISIVKGLVHHFTAIEDEEILDKIYDDFMNDDSITTILNNDFQDIINRYLTK